MLQPDQVYTSVAELPVESLADEYNAVIFDRDHVLIDETGTCDPQRREAYDAINDRMETCILTNETLRYDGDPVPIADRFDTYVIDDTEPKPDSEGFEKALAMLDAEPEETVMVGDSPITDIYGGNNAGLTTIQVEPYGTYPFPLSVSKPLEHGLQRVESLVQDLF
ncbi:MAG: HAD-IA family hydrolase [Candidatus Nanohaloarchaeota archaeon QJJ-5]|nr:HAD-IA family hydrolase [Candidatus Nanohaloarchaeota archaeon QJJ-5]